jgi:hypothetical protein
VLLVRAGIVFAFAGLAFVAFLDVSFFATVSSSDAGRPKHGEG